MQIFELLNVILTNYSKWYKSAKTNGHRRYGFSISFLVSILWIAYFFKHRQYYLSINSALTLLLAVRGYINNR